ncbi:hypothetical protein [Nocardia sp. CA-145437]|uniref:hypothetical protein n=1 Tax=Nocardia sp. CA-145437 TaxID=3239980 RepID=UPI003D99D1B6
MNARNLTLATAAFALTFWAWNLIGPLSSSYTKQLVGAAGGALTAVAVLLFTLEIGRELRQAAPAAEVRQRV